jgi:hypothetical protein
MMSPPDHSEFEREVRAITAKFEYGFLTLIFASLALSFQFSPNMGTALPSALIGSWILLLGAGLVGGIRLMKQAVFYRLNLQKVKIAGYLKASKFNMTDPQFNQLMKLNVLIDADTLTPLTQAQMQSAISKDEALLTIATKNMSKEEKWMPILFRIQAWLFLGGVLMNATFVIVNYLHKVQGSL